MKKMLLLALLVLAALPLRAQVPLPDSSADRSFKRFDLFPAVSYAPETKLTMGVIGNYYLDLYRGDPGTRLSNVTFLAAYTLAQQVAIEGYWEVFSDGNRWRYRGEAFYNRYPDRNYGRGNEAGALVAEIDGEQVDTVNYLHFNSDRIRLAPIVLRRIGPSLYLGLQGDMEYLYRMRDIPDDYVFLNADSACITGLPVDGVRSGLGLQLLYDSRDNVLNPLRGTYLELGNHFYGRMLGSDYTFSSYRLDARQFIPFGHNQTLALRGVVNVRFSEGEIPMRGLSQVGGRNLMRGYFKGTYQDNHLLAFEAEYRLPLWREPPDAPWWQVWKRLGLVAFAGGAEVADALGHFRLDGFRLAAGGGLRILFNRETRVNLRIDYAFALAPDSGGPGKRQSGFYFFLGEAF